MQKYDQKQIKKVDRKLAFYFGAVMLVLMLTAEISASYLFIKLKHQDENRLSIALATTLSESISRVSFSGKYQTRLLVEEMLKSVKELVYISVENLNNQIIAHSNSLYNDSLVSVKDQKDNNLCLTNKKALIFEKSFNGSYIKEIIIPFYGEFDNQPQGTVRIGISLNEVNKVQQENYYKLLVLAAILTILSVLTVFILSRYFGRTVRFLANQLQSILKNAPMVIIISDRNGNIIINNRDSNSTLISKNKNQDESTDFSLFEDKITTDKLVDMDRHVLADGKNLDVELTTVSNDKTVYWQISKFPIDNDTNAESSLICTFIKDISELRATKISLQENEDTFRQIFDSSMDAILLLKDGIFVECNNAALIQLGGMKREELISSSPAKISPEFQPDGKRSADSANEKIKSAMILGNNRFEWLHTKIDGSPFYVDIALATVIIKGEKMLHVTWRDITALKQAAIEKDKLQNQLLHAQKMESIGRLAGGVAHDFNNMLSVMIGFAELTTKKISPADPIWQYMQEILKAGKRSSDLTRQLLAFARKQETNPKIISINDNIAGMLKMLKRLLGENIDLIWLPAQNLKTVKMDPSQLDQILANLTVNARDAIVDNGKISIETANAHFDESYCSANPNFLPGDFVLISVSDNGCGMDNETKSHIFEPFFTTKELGQGTGLGLATVYGIVEQNKGFISIYSELNIGTAFHIYLPIFMTDEEKSIHKSDDSESNLPFGSETILLVEDEPSVLLFTKQVLEDLGYHILETDKPSEALKIAEEYDGKIHLLLTDVIMPDMNGRELSLKVNSLRPKIKNLFMSGYTSNVIGKHGILDEDLQFIHKPFGINELAEKVRSILD